MPWVNLDDQFPDHPKVAGLSDAAFRLHVAGICYSNRHLSDGLVPGDEVPRLVRRYKRTALQELVERMLWHPVMGGEAYSIHDFLDWNDSRKKVEKRKNDKAERMRKWREEQERLRREGGIG